MAVEDDGCLWTIYGEGGGCTLEVTGEASGVWIPLHGSLQVHSSGLNQPVHAGEVLVTEHDNHARAVGHASGRWLVLLGGKRVWKWLLMLASASETQLLPEMHEADRELRRAAIAVVRATQPLELAGAVHAVTDKIATLQAPMYMAIARCPGRTWAKQRWVFLRLQRVRNYIAACCNRNLDNKALALMAHFSPCYFLRTFKAVYLETPHAYLLDQRLKRAKRMLHTSGLAITEVALASGFENRSVFSRTFRQRFGITAQETRRRVTGLAMAE
ncbi:MAG: hypothetical protein ABT18_15370 [Rhodanobacter sp. SCN 66-43]|nr:MAG: hypothetical protein ABT18_15370 [Rhodanobacter sp. SCN 66-43]